MKLVDILFVPHLTPPHSHSHYVCIFLLLPLSSNLNNHIFVYFAKIIKILFSWWFRLFFAFLFSHTLLFGFDFDCMYNTRALSTDRKKNPLRHSFQTDRNDLIFCSCQRLHYYFWFNVEGLFFPVVREFLKRKKYIYVIFKISDQNIAWNANAHKIWNSRIWHMWKRWDLFNLPQLL